MKDSLSTIASEPKVEMLVPVSDVHYQYFRSCPAQRKECGI